MNFKLAVYAECPTCGGKGIVQGKFRFIPCTEGNCNEGYRTVLVTFEEMQALLAGKSALEVTGTRFRVVPVPLSPKPAPKPPRVVPPPSPSRSGEA
jgi:hypothetical protein